MKKNIFIVAGGTGGHINAALGMGDYFSSLDYQVIYISGQRHLDYKLFEGKNCYHLNMRALRVKNIFKLTSNLFFNMLATISLLRLFVLKKPVFVIGAGGYVCGPTFLVAKMLLKPLFIIEQNAISGLTNKWLAKISDLVFTHFKTTKGFENIDPQKIKAFGNPIRNTIQFSENTKGGVINILVFGGSLGATQINSVIEKLVQQPSEIDLNIIHQVGKDHLIDFHSKQPNIKYQSFEYLDNIEENYKWANIIIARAGASTISELREIKKPSLLIPFPAAVDNHQFYNAKELQAEDLSYIAVLDHSLSIEELCIKVREEVYKICKENLFYARENNRHNATKLIGDEIVNYVRNK